MDLLMPFSANRMKMVVKWVEWKRVWRLLSTLLSRFFSLLFFLLFNESTYSLLIIHDETHNIIHERLSGIIDTTNRKTTTTTITPEYNAEENQSRVELRATLKSPMKRSVQSQVERWAGFYSVEWGNYDATYDELPCCTSLSAHSFMRLFNSSLSWSRASNYRNCVSISLCTSKCVTQTEILISCNQFNVSKHPTRMKNVMMTMI